MRAEWTDVRDLLTTDIPKEVAERFIQTASRVVDHSIASEVDDEDLLHEIESWLAAHFVAITPKYRLTKDEQVGDERFVFQGAGDGKGLDATTYGQQVKILDPTGNLARFMSEENLTFKWKFHAGAPDSI